MSCTLTLGRLVPCKDTQAGIKTLYFINNVAGGLGLTESSNEVTAIDDGAASPAQVAAFKYDLDSESTFTENIMSERGNGTTAIEQLLVAVLHKQDKDTQNEVLLMAYGRPHILAVYYDGTQRLIGHRNGCHLGGNGQLDGPQEGFNGYNLNFSAKEARFAPFVTGDPATLFSSVTSGT